MAELSRDPRRLPGLTLIACVMVMLVGLPLLEVHAGSLVLEAPPGARVTIDGQLVGTTPLPSPLLLEPGLHSVRLDLPGAHSSVADLQVEPDDAIVHLTMHLAPKSRTNAAARSVLLAGLGQHYVERHKLGWAFTVAEVGAVVVAGLAQLSFEQSEDDYNEARERYENLLDPDEIEAAQADAESAYDDMGSAESMRNAALLVAGAAVLASALDAWIRFPQVDLALGDSPAGAAGVGTGSSHAAAAAPWAGSAMASGNVGFHLSLRARF